MIPENELRLALEEYQQVVLEALPQPDQCEHIFSPQFEVKMRRVRRRAKHPVAYQTLRRIACAILILLALSASVMAFSPTVRATAVTWVREIFTNSFVKYSSTKDPDTALPAEQKRYELGWLPEGYELVCSDTVGTQDICVYFHVSGRMLEFAYTYGADSPLFIAGEHELQSASVGEYTADLFLAKNENENNVLVWYDTKEDVLFQIAAVEDKTQLVNIAEHIRAKVKA